jgi:hypothetical protein
MHSFTKNVTLRTSTRLTDENFEEVPDLLKQLVGLRVFPTEL